jgi:hypothetical protein
MPNVDTNAPLATNSDAAMWRTDHASACRYIEALLAERTRWASVIKAASKNADDRTVDDLYRLIGLIDAAVKEGFDE